MADKVYKLIFTKDDGSEDVVQFTAPQGEPGEPGKTPVKGTDYFTDADKQEIAGQAAELVEIPDVDLTGYATEEYVKNKIAEAELGREEVDLSGYAQKSELPTKVSQLQNDKGYLTEHQDISGKLDTSALPTAINTALAQAKASGDFKGDPGTPGKDGVDGQPGKDGTSATHSWNGTVLTVTSASGTSSADLRGEPGKDGSAGSPGADGVSPTVAVSKSGKVTTISITDKSGTKTATINDGADGSPGSAGKDGTSVTHSWSGTTLSVTSASGTSSANLKGEKGDKGDKGDSIKGDKGDTGAAGTSVTVKSVSESTADGGSNVVTFSDGKTVTIKNGSKGSTGEKGDTGATGGKGADGVSVSSVKQTTTSNADGGSNVVTVTLSNGTTSTFTVKNGSKGSTGAAGANGKTPVKGVDYFTAADQEAIVQQVITALGTPVFGRVDADNNIILTGELADGTYTLKYEDAEGKQTVIGDLILAKSGEILVEWTPGYNIDGNTGVVSQSSFTWGDAGVIHVGGPIELVSGRTYRLVTTDARYSNMYAYYYTASGTYISRETLWDARNATAAAPYNVAMTIPSNAGLVRFRATAGTQASGTSDLVTNIKPVLKWEVS